MAIVARRRRYVGDDSVPLYVYDESGNPVPAENAAASGLSPIATSSVPAGPSTTAADFATEVATFLDTGEWISVPNPGSTWGDVGQNIWTGQPTPAQIQLSAQAAARQMAQAGGTPAQIAAAAAEAQKQMEDNPAPSAGFLGLPGWAWGVMGGSVVLLLILAKK